MTFLIPVDRYQHRLATTVLLALLYTARKCERHQLRMRAISCRKHMKLKNTKFYSKGVLVNHTKISTNKNFPLYDINGIHDLCCVTVSTTGSIRVEI